MGQENYVFRPKPEVADWIDDNIDSWTSYCYDNIYKDQKKQYVRDINRIANIMAFCFIGMIILCLTLLPGIIMLMYIIFMVTGISFIVMGFVILSLEYRSNHGRR